MAGLRLNADQARFHFRFLFKGQGPGASLGGRGEHAHLDHIAAVQGFRRTADALPATVDLDVGRTRPVHVRQFNDAPLAAQVHHGAV
jgi:hypothetical protein